MVPAVKVLAEGMCLNGKCFGERESASKKGWGHISCKCSQMLVKVHQLCSCDWKNLFLERLQPPEASAAMLLSCLIYLCVCGQEQCGQCWNYKSPTEKSDTSDTSTDVSVLAHVSVSLYGQSLCLCSHFVAVARGSRSPSVMKCNSHV